MIREHAIHWLDRLYSTRRTSREILRLIVFIRAGLGSLIIKCVSALLSRKIFVNCSPDYFKRL
jgi:hypothetical protein